MEIHTGKFSKTSTHHYGWFRVFRGKGIAEIWLGRRYMTISWRR